MEHVNGIPPPNRWTDRVKESMARTIPLNRTTQKHTSDTPQWTKGQKVWLDVKNLALPHRTIKLAPR